MNSRSVVFPAFQDTQINMMPIIMGDWSTLPSFVERYRPMISACEATHGDTVYLTVHESYVESGKTQRRPGIHTDGTCVGGWGSWGGATQEGGGIWMASTDGDCLLWDETVDPSEVDGQGALLRGPTGSGVRAEPNRLYHISDRTPHASIPAQTGHYRQFFRLVGPKIFGWYAKHSTPNPLGVLPQTRILEHSKF